MVFCVLYQISSISAANFLSNALGSHMVLQRAPQRAHLWGWTTAGATVSVLFNGQTYTSTADSTGQWSSYLPATPAGGPYTIKISSSAGQSALLEDVLFGDVYVCGGQSNMQMTVHSVFNATAEIAAANDYPNIRVFTVGQGTFSAAPLQEFATVSQPWTPASASSIGVGDWSEFSATCWFFGKYLYDDLQVPLGLFSSNWGGTPVEAWSSPDALAKCPVKESEQLGGPGDKSQLWNAMIVPILQMSISGATWYQGEANAGDPNLYACTFPEMIRDWRAKWGGSTSSTFPFYFVQLAPWLNTDNQLESLTRLAQLYALALPEVGVATAMDWGDPSSPYNNIHPRFKQIVGWRLHLAARGIGYKENVQYKGPEAVAWKVLPGEQYVQVDFVNSDAGLVFVQKGCDVGVPIEQCGWWDIQTESGWTNSSAAISGRSVIVSLPKAATKITGVRYAWANYPVATLYNKEGLPAIPFYFPNPIVPPKVH
uniref:Sialate O-acetylesterase domain-containing protein n=1 Tax=Arcella intermedia TaxID=1963864 RepID=A0A6B2L341_9EUKA